MRCPNARVSLFALATALTGLPALGAEAPVPATAPYRESYGPPPRSEGQQCLAAVVYLPGVGASGSPKRLSAVPLFSVNPAGVIQEAARVVVQGYPLSARLVELPHLFPIGTELRAVEVDQGAAKVRVSRALPEPLEALAVQALAHTLSQFEGVRSVSLQVEGKAPSGPVRPDPTVLEPPPPPRLLDVVSAVHTDEEPSEIDVLFDRPVDVTFFEIRLADGTGLPGETYTSMFDMAVVFRPRDPKILRAGLPLEIIWDVRDKTGRTARGKRTIELRVYTRPE